jgi:signal transduction histidine kinase
VASWGERPGVAGLLRAILAGVALAGVLAAVYVLACLALGVAVADVVPRGTALKVVLALSAGAAVAARTARWVIRRIDRRLFRIRYDRAGTMADMKRLVDVAASQRDLAEVVRLTLRDALSPGRVAVLVRSAHQWSGAGDLEGAWAADPAALAGLLDSGLPGPARAATACGNDVPVAVAASGFVVVRPIVVGGSAAGFMLLGRREAGRPYLEWDLGLLAGVADIAAVALERMNLLQAVLEESMARARMDEIQQMKTDFLSRVSHDLRTPLASINWSARNLVDGVAGPLEPRQQRFLRSVQASADQLERLVNNLLSVSRLEVADEPVPVGPVELAPVLDEVLVGLEPLATLRGVGFRTELPADLGEVLANREKLFDVLINVLENAMKYSPRGAAVEVTASAEGPDSVVVQVRDHGPGLRGADPEALFERFRQGDASPHSGGRGFGIGLYIVKSYVERFHGSVWAADHPGGGAQFSCRLVRPGQPTREAGRA